MTGLVSLLSGCGGGGTAVTNTTDIEPEANITNKISLFEEFNVGFGGSYFMRFTSSIGDDPIWVSTVDVLLDADVGSNNAYQEIQNFDPDAFNALHADLQGTKFLVYWLTKEWEENWINLSAVQKAMDAGYVPVFMYWYFGDMLISSLPTAPEVLAYKENNNKLSNFLAQLSGQKLVIMEPEFNKSYLLSNAQYQTDFANIMADSIDIIKAKNPEALFSLTMTDTGKRSQVDTDPDCGYENCALGDKKAWAETEMIYNLLNDKLDFLSFQEMVSTFNRDSSHPDDAIGAHPIVFSDEEKGIDFLAQRINNFSAYLHTKYNKPVFLPYIAIGTATWIDENSNGLIDESELDYGGWEEKANQTYEALSKIRTDLLNNGLFGYAPIALFDTPRHDYGGYQYFMNNEYHLGVIKSASIDEVDLFIDGDFQYKLECIKHIFKPFP